MDANGLLTVLAILIAGLSLLSEEKRTDLRLRTSKIDLLMLFVSLLIIFVVIYSPVILSLGLFHPIGWLWGFTKETLVFSCLIFIISLFGWKLLGWKVPTSNFYLWSDISQRLLRNKKLPQLGYLFEKYHEQFFDFIEKDIWYVKAHNALSPSIFQLIEFGMPPKRWYTNSLCFLKEGVAKLLPSRNEKRDVMETSVSNILKSKSFTQHLSESHPLVGAKATTVRFRDSDEFTNSFLKALISHPGSHLYRELKDNQNCSHTGRYYIDENNQLLNCYLQDVSVAIDVQIWRPIGDYVTEFIKKQRGKDNFYNQPNGRFSDGDDRWNCPIFVGMQFFSVMVSAGVFQRSKDHMWLMYCERFFEGIIENLEHAGDVDKSTEFPSRFDYLLYHVFSGCDSWVGSILSLDYTGWSDEDKELSPEYWAAKAMGSMLYNVMSSNKIISSQKLYFLDIVIRRMNGLDRGGFERYSELILDCSVRKYEFSSVDQSVVKEIRDVYQQVDHVLKSKKSTFEIELAKY